MSSTQDPAQSISSITLTATTSDVPPRTVTHTLSDPATIAYLKIGDNKLLLDKAEIIALYNTNGLQVEHTLTLGYGDISEVSFLPNDPSPYVAKPITLSNFPAISSYYTTNGTVTIQAPTSSLISTTPATFEYTIVGDMSILSITGSLVKMLAVGTTTIRATQILPPGYARPYIDAIVTIIRPKGFYEISDANFMEGAGFPQNVSGMTLLFSNIDDNSYSVAVPYNFNISGVSYTTLWVSSNNMLAFGGPSPGGSIGSSQSPTSTYRFLSFDTITTVYYKFSTDNSKINIVVTGRAWSLAEFTFVFKLILTKDGFVETNFKFTGTTTAALDFTRGMVVGYVGTDTVVQFDDTFLTVNGVTFNSLTSVTPTPLLNNKTFGILLSPLPPPTWGAVSLPSIFSDQAYTVQLIPPISNSTGVFTFSSSNAAVATISTSGSVSFITIKQTGTTTITVRQTTTSDYGMLSVSYMLVVTAVPSPTWTPLFILPTGLIYTPGTTPGSITRRFTAPSSNSTGAFSLSSSHTNVATVDNNGGGVFTITILSAGLTTFTLSQISAGNYGFLSKVISISTYTGNRIFNEITDTDFKSLDFTTGMTTLFTLQDSISALITMPNNNFKYNSTSYTNLYLSSEGALYFGTQQSEYNWGMDSQLPINSFRFFGWDHMSAGSYKFLPDGSKLLVMLTGFRYYDTTRTFTVKLIIDQYGGIQTNYIIASAYNSDYMIIGAIGSNSGSTMDDTFAVIDGITLNGSIGSLNVYALLNGKTIAYDVGLLPTFGSFTLPSGLTQYQNQTITKTLTPPSSSNNSGAFTFTSSNLNVATIIVDSQGASSINVVGPGTAAITATQAASDGYSKSSVTTTLVVTVTYPTWSTAFTLPSDLNLYQGQPITKTLTVPTSIDSSGAFTFSSSDTNIATIIVDSQGASSIQIVGPGTVTITATQAPSGIYYSLSQSVTIDVISIVLDSSNGKTIKLVGVISSSIYIIQASPRGTPEWFAIVTQQAKSSITSYAKGEAAGIAAFTKVISSNESVEVHFNNIVTSLMTDMNSLFNSASNFNSDISSWDTSSVINMNNMFYGAYVFNQDIGYWNTSKVTTMYSMFGGASVFNNGGFATINNWDTSKVTTMCGMFQNAQKFNQPIGKWNTSKVTNTFAMFQNAQKFNQPIGYNPNVSNTAWDTSNVTNMDYMFSAAAAFNNGGSPNIGNWNTFLVDSMYGMFGGASAFNQDIGYYPSVSTTAWNTSKVTLMGEMFTSASVFNNGGSSNIGIGNWITSSVTNMYFMFANASLFNQDISKWVVINVSPKPPTAFNSGATSLNPLYLPNWYGEVMYINLNPTIPSLSLANFPRLGAMTNWELSINFNASGGTNTWRALIGNMSNARGWGVWVSAFNGIHFSWNNNLYTWNATNFTVSINTNYKLKITRTPTSLTFLLTDEATNATQTATNTAMSDINTYVMSTNGPVTIGGWIGNSSENFPGTISYVGVRNPNASITTIAAPLNLLSRYDASVASSYILSGNDVTQWNDLTGNGYNLTANGTGPTMSTINSVPAFNFYSVRGLICSSVPLVTPITIFMVVKYSTLIGGYGNFMHHGDRDYDWSLERDGFTTNIKFESNNVNNCVIAATDNTNYIWVGRIVGNIRQFSMYSDTVAPKYISGTPVVIVPGNKPLCVGKSNIGEGCNSNIGEILYYSASLSDNDVTQNVAYLSNKWFKYT